MKLQEFYVGACVMLAGRADAPLTMRSAFQLTIEVNLSSRGPAAPVPLQLRRP